MFIWIFSLWGHVQSLLLTHPPTNVAYHVSALVQVLACGLFGVKQLPEPGDADLLSIGPLEINFGEFESKYKTFHSRKCVWNCRLRNGAHFVQGEVSYFAHGLQFGRMSWRMCGLFEGKLNRVSTVSPARCRFQHAGAARRRLAEKLGSAWSKRAAGCVTCARVCCF